MAATTRRQLHSSGPGLPSLPKRRQSLFFSLGLLCAGPGLAADRAIVLNPVNTAAWEFATHTPTPRMRPGLAVGFWQRASGAKRGVGANYVSAPSLW